MVLVSPAGLPVNTSAGLRAQVLLQLTCITSRVLFYYCAVVPMVIVCECMP